MYYYKTHKSSFLILMAISVACISLTSCASIVRGGKSEISITSEPSNVSINIIETNSQEEVHSATTPTTVILKRGRGFFKKADYKITLQAPGEKPVVLRLAPGKWSGWAYPTIIFPFVDPLTGALYEWESPIKISGNASVSANIKGRKNNTLFIQYTENKQNDETFVNIDELVVEEEPEDTNE